MSKEPTKEPASTAVAKPERIAVTDAGSFSALMDSNRFAHLQRVAQVFATSNLVPQHYRGKTADCILAVAAAMRLAVDPLMFMQNTYPGPGGRTGMEGKLAIALVNARGPFKGPVQFKYSGEGVGRSCTAWAIHRDTNERCEITVTVEMAKAEGWYDRNPKWKNLPDLMLAYRAGAWLGRIYCPEALLGMQTLEELEDVAGARAAASTATVIPADVVPITPEDLCAPGPEPELEPDPEPSAEPAPPNPPEPELDLPPNVDFEAEVEAVLRAEGKLAQDAQKGTVRRLVAERLNEMARKRGAESWAALKAAAESGERGDAMDALSIIANSLLDQREAAAAKG